MNPGPGREARQMVPLPTRRLLGLALLGALPLAAAAIEPLAIYLAALYLAWERSDVWGMVAVQSASVNRRNDALLRQIRRGPARPWRVFAVVGSYERAVRLGGRPVDLVAAHRRLCETLQAMGSVHRCLEVPEGHGWGLWRTRLLDGLTFLSGREDDKQGGQE